MRVKLIRLLVVLYLPLVVGMYFVFLHGSYARIDALMADLQGLRKSEERQAAVQQAEKVMDQQREVVRRLVERFNARVEDFGAADLPLFIGNLAEAHGVRFARLDLQEETNLEGAGFLQAEADVRGAYAGLVAFLNDLEENPTRFALVDRVRITPQADQGPYRLVVRFAVMLRGIVPAPDRPAGEGKKTAAADTASQLGSGT